MKFAAFRTTALVGAVCQALGGLAQTVAGTQLPTGGNVSAGQATIQSSGAAMTVNQSSNRAVVDWNTFNVGSQAKVTFNQPSANAVILNRVLDSNPSQILGQISATGQVFISNPNGVIFGTSAQVDVGGLVATTQRIGNADFMAGKSTWQGDGTQATVLNQGTLQSVLGGYIALLAPTVRNEGVIVAREGTVALAAGNQTTLEFSGARLVSLLVAQPVVDALIENKQLVRADGGYVVMSARSANALLGSVINNSGTVQARTVAGQTGRIEVDGGTQGVVTVSGQLDASASVDAASTSAAGAAATAASDVGGRISVTGDKVRVASGARLDASGPAGGGTVEVGGGWQGGDASVRNANAVIVESGATLDASATGKGNGGQVVVFSSLQNDSGSTQVAGQLLARGGAQGGDGGRIETSGHWLSTAGATGDASAPLGKGGSWLFDPYDVTITSATSNNSPSGGTWTASGSSSTISNTAINSLLNAGTSVTVSTSGAGTDAGNILVNSSITQLATAPAASLTLSANHNITISSLISMTQSGSKLELVAGNGSTGGNVAFNAAVNADTVNMTLTGAGTVTQTTALTANNLGINGSGTTVTLNNAGNNIGVLAANVASIALVSNTGIDQGSVYGQGLYVGTVESLSGVTASGTISLSSNTNLFVNQSIATTSTSATSAMVLTAGASLAPGAYSGSDSAVNSNGPNVVLGSGATLTVGTGGRGTIYSGSSSGSGQALANYIGLGSGHFRYNSNASNTNYTQALGAGLYAIYRQAPVLTVTASNATTVYGTAPTLTANTVTGYLNGDTLAQSVSNAGTVTTGGATSGAGYTTAGTHSLTPTGVLGGLGYAFNYVAGTLTVTPKALTVLSTTTTRVYDTTTAATTQLSTSQLSGDVVTATGTSSTFDTKNAGAGKTVTTSGVTLSGADAANYSLASTTVTGTGTVTAKSLTASYTASNKVYDGTLTASVSGTTNDILGNDVVNLTQSAANFSDKNVGTGKTVSITGITLTGSDATNYLLQSATASATASITPRALTATYTAANKTYDGTTAATVTASSAQIVSGDVVTFSNTGAVFSDANVGTGKTVSISGIGIGGTGASNYSLSNATATTLANITPKALTIAGITAANKVYDGTTAATVSTSNLSMTGLVGSDVVTLQSSSGAFSDKNAGTAKTVTLTNTYGGASLSNYNIVDQTTTTASITPRLLAVTATANNKVYDTTRQATYSLTSNQLVNDSLTLSASSALFDTKNAGTGKTVTIGGITVSGTDAGNYTLQNSATSTTANITPATLAPTGLSVANKVYDGTTQASLSGTSSITALGSDSVSLSGVASAAFADKNVGNNKTIVTSGLSLTGTDAANYTLAVPALTANITPASLTVTAVAASKTYDGTTTAAGTPTVGGTLAGAGAGEVIGSAGTQAFLDPNAGVQKTVRASGVTVLDSANANVTGNYNITYVDNTSSSITPKNVTLTAISAASKIYDGTATATITGGNVSGTVGQESLSVSGTGSFDSANAGTARTVTVADVTQLGKVNGSGLAGGNWNNYNLTTTGPMTTTADITPKNVTLAAITAADKTYDGTAVASITGGNVVGTVGAETLSVSGTGSFDTANAGTAKTVTVADVTQLSKVNGSGSAGGNWSNYTLTTTGAMTTTADVAKKDVTLGSISADSKYFDNSVAANVSSSNVQGTVGGDTLSVSGQGRFDTVNVGVGKTVTVDPSQLTQTNGSGNWSNYNLTGGPITTTANILPTNNGCPSCVNAAALSSLLSAVSVSTPSAAAATAPLSQQVDTSAIRAAATSTTAVTQAVRQSTLTPSIVVISLSPQQVAWLTPAQLAPLIPYLTVDQLLAVTDSQARALPKAQLDQFLSRLEQVSQGGSR